jgi:hypothetical protein
MSRKPGCADDADRFITLKPGALMEDFPQLLRTVNVFAVRAGNFGTCEGNVFGKPNMVYPATSTAIEPRHGRSKLDDFGRLNTKRSR